MIFKNSESSKSESDSDDEFQDEEDPEAAVSPRQFRNSLVVPGRDPSKNLSFIQIKKPKKSTPYNSLEDEGYVAEIDIR